MEEDVTIPQSSTVVLTPFYALLYITHHRKGLPRQSSTACQFTYSVNRAGVYRDSTKTGSRMERDLL